MKNARRIRLAVAAALAATTLAGAAVTASPAVASPAQSPARTPTQTRTQAPAALPTAAVALGDSFISGEGAGAYQAVPDLTGVLQGFPGWSAPNSNPFFCHRSANASINAAVLPGISARFNLACSGGQPYDFANASNTRASGRTVPAQLDQLRAVAQTHDIDLVLVGLGSNNSSFTFGSVAVECAGRFVADGFIGWWEFWVPLINWITGSSSPESPCTMANMATPQQVAAAQAETIAALRQLVLVLAEIDADGQHRIVLQDYTNPLPPDFHVNFHKEDGRDDTRDKFRDLVRERYAAGCPAHRASLGPAHQFSQALGSIVQGAHTALRAEFPTTDLVYLNVQRAFDGARLCEQSNSPAGALATPVRLMDRTSSGAPTGVHLTNINNFDKLDISRVQAVCKSYFQSCQESWHPNAAGHAVLGQCLAAAATAVNDPRIDCVRNPVTGVVTAS